MDCSSRRRRAGLLPWLAAGLFALCGCNAAAVPATHEDVYYVRQQIGLAGGEPVIASQALLPVTLHRTASGSRLHVRYAWLKADVNRQDSYELDARYDDDAAALAFLASGLETRLDRSGKVVSVGAVDPQAMDALVVYKPLVRKALAQAGEMLGVRPFVLPKTLRVGQQLHETQAVPGLGEMALSMQVTALDAQQAELWVRGKVNGAAMLHGYQVVRRDSGLPVEAWLEMQVPAPDDLPSGSGQTMHIQVLAISQRHAVTMGATHWDAETWAAYRDNFATLSGTPLFREGVVGDTPLREAEAEVASRLFAPLSAEQRTRIRRSLGYTFTDIGGGRPLLQLQGQYDVPAEGAWPRPFVMRLRGARLLDAAGQALAGVEVVPNRLFELTSGQGEIRLHEREDSFPFRLPPGLPATAIDALARIELDVELAGHVPDERYVVAAGKQPAAAGMRLEWSRHWAELTVRPDTTMADDQWVVVPLDAQGRPLRHVGIPWSDAMAAAVVPGEAPPLASPMQDRHYRAIAGEAVAAVELRRYSLRWERDTWAFVGAAGDARDGVAMVERHVAELPYLPATAVSGRELLAAFDPLVVDPGNDEVLVPLRKGLDDTAMQFCEVVPRDVAGEAHRRSRMDRFRSGDPGWVGWTVPAEVFDGGEVAVVARCPSRLEPVRERVGVDACFRDAGNGRVAVAATCREDVAQALAANTLVARDAGGRPLEEAGHGAAGAELHFHGQAQVIERLRVHADTVQRALVLGSGKVR